MSTFTPDLTFGPYQAGYELDGSWNQRTIKYVTSPPPGTTYYLELEDGSGALLLESGDFILLEDAP